MEGKRKPSKPKVASFTDAWIETLQRYNNNSKSQVASFTDAWIETKIMADLGIKDRSRILYGCVD